jgi:hypothetical protein
MADRKATKAEYSKWQGKADDAFYSATEYKDLKPVAIRVEMSKALKKAGCPAEIEASVVDQWYGDIGGDDVHDSDRQQLKGAEKMEDGPKEGDYAAETGGHYSVMALADLKKRYPEGRRYVRKGGEWVPMHPEHAARYNAKPKAEALLARISEGKFGDKSPAAETMYRDALHNGVAQRHGGHYGYMKGKYFYYKEGSKHWRVLLSDDVDGKGPHDEDHGHYVDPTTGKLKLTKGSEIRRLEAQRDAAEDQNDHKKAQELQDQITKLRQEIAKDALAARKAKK